MKLNTKQKQFLFDEYYVDARVLDALTYKGWQDYFIKDFTWDLDTESNWYGFNELVLVNKKDSDISYRVDLNFQGNDLDILLGLEE